MEAAVSITEIHWKDLVLFHEFFHGDTGRGLGASHQTGWTALVTRCIEDLAGNLTVHVASPRELVPAATKLHAFAP
jgi:hypothetical protein